MKSKQRVQRLLRRYRRKEEPVIAMVGNHERTINVSGRDGYIYARLQNGDVIQVYNNLAPAMIDTEIAIGFDPKSPNLLQVIYAVGGKGRYGTTANSKRGPSHHHKSHQWLAGGGAGDTVFTELRQFMPFRPTPAGGLKLHINRGVSWINDEWRYTTGSNNLDFSPYIPASGTAQYALVYLDNEGEPGFIVGSGSLTASKELDLDDIPPHVPGTLSIAAVKLYGDQEQIVEARSNTDLIDLRFPMRHDHPFTDLDDTPNMYTGSAGMAAVVNSGETGLEFIDLSVTGGTSGGVSADANIADNSVVRGDGGIRGVQDSGVFINDAGAIITGTWQATPIQDTYIDFGTGSNQVSAIDVPITDDGGYYTGTNVELALQELAGGGGGTFLELSDTPGFYTGSAGLGVIVNSAEDALIYAHVTGAGGGGASAFIDLTDTPVSYTGYAGYGVTVNDTEDGLVYSFVTGTVATGMQVDQSAGTADTYGILSGTLDGANTTFTTSLQSYISGDLTVYLNGQLQTQGSSEDWVETTPASGVFDFATAPEATDLITVIYNTVVAGTTVGADGWVALTDTWTYSSADAPTYVISVDADVTGVVGVGQRLKLTHGGDVKYFIVTVVGAFGGGVTLVTVYGGTDYTLSASAFTLPYYSTAKSPLGFPLAATKWTVEVADTTSRSQATPTEDVWYNVGSMAITIPIGSWNFSYQITVRFAATTATYINGSVTLSTANNSESSLYNTSYAAVVGASATLNVKQPFHRSFPIEISAKDVYYMNANLNSTNGTPATMYYENNNSTMILRAVCAYL